MKKFTSHRTTVIQRVIIFLAGSQSLVPTGCSAEHQVMLLAHMGGCTAGEEPQPRKPEFFQWAANHPLSALEEDCPYCTGHICSLLWNET